MYDDQLIRGFVEAEYRGARVRGRFRDTNHAVAERNGQQYIVKSHDTRTLCNPFKVASVYEIAVDAGLTPELIRSRSGTLITKWDDQLYSFQRLYDGTNAQEEQARMVGSRLAKLHLALGSLGKLSIENHLEQTVGTVTKRLAQYGLSEYEDIMAPAQEILDKEPRQVIHGDLHRGNILMSEEHIYFLDFDSATLRHPFFDIAFCAFRLCGYSARKIETFMESYERAGGGPLPQMSEVWSLVAHQILQRIIFIRQKADEGERQWLCDLKTQKAYLDTVFVAWKRLH